MKESNSPSQNNLPSTQLIEKINDLDTHLWRVVHVYHWKNAMPLLKLAAALKNKISEFNNPDLTPEMLKKLEPEFKTLLHSKDSIMQEHRQYWKIVAFNLALAFTGIGLFFVAIKVLHSAITQNRFALFFEDTQRIQKINAIDEEFSRSCDVLKNELAIQNP